MSDAPTAPPAGEAAELLAAARELLADLQTEEDNRDGLFAIEPDVRCIDCTRGVRNERTCARHRVERIVEAAARTREAPPQEPQAATVDVQALAAHIDALAWEGVRVTGLHIRAFAPLPQTSAATEGVTHECCGAPAPYHASDCKACATEAQEPALARLREETEEWSWKELAEEELRRLASLLEGEGKP